MAQEDRQKWDQRYREGAYAQRTHPSAWLQQWLPEAPRGRALDVACGAGRNALYLADKGYRVDAVDISSEALARGEQSARSRGVAVNWMEWDLDQRPALAPGYQLILLIRYVDLRLLQWLATLLAPGGLLLCEEHLVYSGGQQVIGPRNPAFRVKPGDLEKATSGLSMLCVEEGLVEEPDGGLAALARLVATRP